MSTGNYGFVLLAAGGSCRLGRPKALLPHGDTTMLGHMLREMNALSSWPIMVVTGSRKELLQHTLNEARVASVYNGNWKEGMASSIRCGVAALLALAPVEGIVIAGLDQPAAGAGLFHSLAEQHEITGKAIVAARYSDTLGIPVLFGKKYFLGLQNIYGEKGAKQLLELHGEDLASAPFPSGEIDIDTEEDYAAWKAQS